jgi:glycosyltransferase involved in cell wall biosynthesis
VNGASVGVVPNLPIPLNRFALSSKLFEYVLLGVPVVSAGLPTLREYFSDEEVRFFEPGNAESLAEALLEVARDPHAASLRAERARLRYASYRWHVSRERYIGILDRLATHGDSAPRSNSELNASSRP